MLDEGEKTPEPLQEIPLSPPPSITTHSYTAASCNIATSPPRWTRGKSGKAEDICRLSIGGRQEPITDITVSPPTPGKLAGCSHILLPSLPPSLPLFCLSCCPYLCLHINTQCVCIVCVHVCVCVCVHVCVCVCACVHVCMCAYIRACVRACDALSVVMFSFVHTQYIISAN